MSNNDKSNAGKSSLPASSTSFCSACSGESEDKRQAQEEIKNLTDRASPTDSEEKFRKRVRISEEEASLAPKKKEAPKQTVYEDDEVLYVVDTPEPQSKPSSKASSKISLSQHFSNFSFYEKSSKKNKELKESTICRCEEKFDIVRKHSFTLPSSSSSESIGSHNCTTCRCVNCPLKQLCWLTLLLILFSLTDQFLSCLQMIQLLMT